MPLTLASPLSLYSIPVAWLTAFYPALPKLNLVKKTIGFNNIDPRGNLGRLEKKDVPPEIIARVARMQAAHQNGNENFPLWAAAVIVGNIAGVDHYTMNIASIGYVSLRVLYNYVYFNQSTRAQSAVRSGVFFTALTLPLFLLIKSANIVLNQGL